MYSTCWRFLWVMAKHGQLMIITCRTEVINITFLTLTFSKVSILDLRSLHTESEIVACVFHFFRIRIPFLSKCMRMWKRRKIEPDPNLFWRTKVSEALCKRDWHNVRSYLFFNVRNFRTQCAMTFNIIKLRYMSQRHSIWFWHWKDSLLLPIYKLSLIIYYI